MNAAAVKITDSASKALKALALTSGNPRGMLLVLQRSIANASKAHLREKDAAEPNRMGGDRSHFWATVADQVFTPPPTKTMAKVSFGHVAIRQKILGGTITAKRTKFLAIPISPISYNTSPRELKYQGRLYFKRLRGGKPGGILIEKATNTALFLLKPSVYQQPTPGTLPNFAVLEPKLLDDAKSFVELELTRASAQPPNQINP